MFYAAHKKTYLKKALDLCVYRKHLTQMYKDTLTHDNHSCITKTLVLLWDRKTRLSVV